MSSLYIEAEVYPGADIQNACREACKLSDRFLLPVRIRFNGVILFAYPGHSVQVEDRTIYMANEYDRKIKQPQPKSPTDR